MRARRLPLRKRSGHGSLCRATTAYLADESITELVHTLDTRVVPYAVFLVVPLMSRTTDVEEDVRRLASLAFAELVKLLPLEADLPDPPGMDSALARQRVEERRFVEQLLDPSKAEPFVLPVRIDAQLRPYQQDGVNWLAFLARYHLHGVLCDDMGLGKTLQTICILASATHAHHQEVARQRAAGVAGAFAKEVVASPRRVWLLNYHGSFHRATEAPQASARCSRSWFAHRR